MIQLGDFSGTGIQSGDLVGQGFSQEILKHLEPFSLISCFLTL